MHRLLCHQEGNDIRCRRVGAMAALVFEAASESASLDEIVARVAEAAGIARSGEELAGKVRVPTDPDRVPDEPARGPGDPARGRDDRGGFRTTPPEGGMIWPAVRIGRPAGGETRTEGGMGLQGAGQVGPRAGRCGSRPG
jgi:hypothetical protein